MSGAGRRALRLDAALLALLWLGSIAGWAALPERFPIHFDASGDPDGWATRDGAGLAVWLLLPLIATLTSLLLRWIPRVARRNPGLWNVPRKREFLALSPDAREPVHSLIEDGMALLTALTTLLLLVLQAVIWSAARGARVPGSVLAGLTALYCVAAVVIAIRVTRRAGVAVVASMEAAR